jgi:hypothetical protein
MSSKGIDCSTPINRTIAADLKSSGYTFACRYLVPDGSKRLTLNEAQILSDAGLNILTVYETAAGRAKGGAANGRIDGAASYKCATALNMPTTGIIYFAVDFDAQPSDMQSVADYLRAARAQTGDYEVGVYGSFAVVEYMGKHDACKGFWQTYAWSPSGAVSAYAIVYQYKNDQTAAGISVDLNEVYLDAGMWSYRVEAKPVTEYTRLIEAVQAAIGAVPDGVPGAQTYSDLAGALGAKGFPYTEQLYGQPFLISGDIIPAIDRGMGVGAFNNSISGSFNSGGKAWSICVSNGQVLHDVSCHALVGCPESVIFQDTAGEFGIQRATNVNEIKRSLKHAVGGLGLLDMYNPAAEGFKRFDAKNDFTDVLRSTNHTILAVKHNKWYGGYIHNMTADQVNAFAKQMGFDFAIMMDGGGWAAINGAPTEAYAHINQDWKQAFIIQFI